MRPHVHARTIRGASRALTMAIAFGFLRHNVYYMCGFNWLPECFEARKSVHADNVNLSASQVAAITRPRLQLPLELVHDALGIILPGICNRRCSSNGIT